MPELPEIEALAAFLRDRAVGRAVARVDVASFTSCVHRRGVRSAR